MGFKPVEPEQLNVLIHESHLGDKSAEAVDLLAAKLAKVLSAGANKQTEALQKLAKTIEDLPKNRVEPCKPPEYIITVTKWNENGRPAEWTAKPVI